jgi:hypothetical protein
MLGNMLQIQLVRIVKGRRYMGTGVVSLHFTLSDNQLSSKISNWVDVEKY